MNDGKTASEPNATGGPPPFGEADAVRIAHDLFGIVASAEPLPAERDRNFLLDAGEAGRFVLKISRPGDPLLLLHAQDEASRTLAEAGLPYRFPRGRPTLAGERIGTVTGQAGLTYPARLLEYVPGSPLAEVSPHSPDLLRAIGHCLGEVDVVLARLDLAGARRELLWDLCRGRSVAGAGLAGIEEPERRELLERFLALYDSRVAPVADRLRRSLIHGDANDFNLLVQPLEPNGDLFASRGIAGLVDFGDMVESYTIAELAIACAYAMMHKPDPVGAAAEVVGGYHAGHPLDEVELEALFPLICLRLCVSVIVAAFRRATEPDNEYLQVSEAPAWALLQRLDRESPDLAHFRFRHACGLEPCPGSASLSGWLQENTAAIGPVVGADPGGPAVVFDLGVGSLELEGLAAPAGEAVWQEFIAARLAAQRASFGIGRYGETRRWYCADRFAVESDAAPEWRSVHLGLDLFLEAGTPVLAPLDGTVHDSWVDSEPGGDGVAVVLQHAVNGGSLRFCTAYAHLDPESVTGLRIGAAVRRGDLLGRIGQAAVNGGWPPHLRVQLVAGVLPAGQRIPGSAPPSQRAVWQSLCPDPSPLVGVAAGPDEPERLAVPDLLEIRQRLLGPTLSVAYRSPLVIVRGSMQYLYDSAGRQFLDAVNNIAHVGHCHPRVVDAISRQAAVLNTNTRYLHERLVALAERLTARLPEPLSVCYFTCSGSEANELALRLARAHTGQRDVIVIDGAYHGNTTSLVEISPYKYDGPGGSGPPPHVRKVTMPDGFRGPHRGQGREVGLAYAAEVGAAIASIREDEGGIGAFFCEPLLSCGGQIVPPAGYLQEAFRLVRSAGGVCVADEVQVGFGRVGSHFWGFESQGVVPDIVTIGKPMGNGHPIAAVVTTPEIAASFVTGMEYFNSFGGNPVSCAAALAVLDVIEEDALQERAAHVGGRLLDGLRTLAERYPLIGDVRGLGLFLGVELVLDRDTLAPATRQAAYAAERLRKLGILLSTDGPCANVLKIKPPLVFSEEDAARLVATLDRVLREDALKAPPAG